MLSRIEKKLSLVLVVAGGLLLGACGGDDNGQANQDTTPPGPVTDVIVTIGDQCATLQWENPADDFSYVQIRRADSSAGEVTPSNGEVVYEGGDTNTVTDTGLTNGNVYLYGFIAFDAAGNASEVVQVQAALPETTVVNFADANLEEVVRATLGLPPGDMTTTDLLALVSLDATNAGIADLDGLQHCINARSLTLSGNALEDGDLEILLQLPLLTTLDLSDNALTKMPALASLQLLSDLRVSGNSAIVSVGTAGAIPSLRNLSIDRTGITDLAPLASAASLVSLSFHSTAVSDLAPLANITTLETLGFNQAAVEDLTPLAGLTALRILMASGNRISDISGMENLGELTSIQLSNNQIHDLQPLVDNTGLGVSVQLMIGNNPLLHDAVATQIPTLLGRGVEVTNSEGLPTDLVGVWTIKSVTVNTVAANPADFFEWDASTVTNRLWVYFNNTYRSEELDDSDAVVYFDSGNALVTDNDVTIQMTSDDGTAVDPPEVTFQGTWSMADDDLVLTQVAEPDTLVLTWTRID